MDREVLRSSWHDLLAPTSIDPGAKQRRIHLVCFSGTSAARRSSTSACGSCVIETFRATELQHTQHVNDFGPVGMLSTQTLARPIGGARGSRSAIICARD